MTGAGTGVEASRGGSDETHSHLTMWKGANRRGEKKQIQTQLRNYTEGKVKRILFHFFTIKKYRCKHVVFFNKKLKCKC